MTGHETVAKLRELEKKEAVELPLKVDVFEIYDAIPELIADFNFSLSAEIYVGLRNSAGLLLEVAGAFREGDSLLLARIGIIIGQSAWKGEYAAEYEAIKRLQAAAERLE